ncbi:MAG: ABC transporter permease, partial [Lachnospiraceae bacterium]|nr:ABC transporter permease [Lachnospiraceae bacterium]
MKNTLILWRLELKRTIKLMPAMLLEACILLIILGAIAFGVGKLLYQDSSIVQINVAIVEEEENPLTELAVNYVQGMESISKSCQFTIVTKEEGFSMLEDGKAAAMIYLPEGMMEGILNGSNVPAQVFFPEDAGTESALLKELADTGIQMLKVAQAEIYGVFDTAKTYGALDRISALEADIDMFNLAFA